MEERVDTCTAGQLRDNLINGDAILLESKRAGAEIGGSEGEEFRYPSYVEDIMGPMCFDHGFGPFRWVCASGDPKDLATSDRIAGDVLEAMLHEAPEAIRQQIADNLHWIRNAQQNKLVVGSQARILYADSEGRIRIAEAFNAAIKAGVISAPIVLGRDHHDVSGTDSPYRETSNIRDGSRFTADMAVQNFVGDAFRGATWISLHNGGGVGWGEVINGGFGMVLDGSADSDRRLKSMLHWDVNNGIARRAWASAWSSSAARPSRNVSMPKRAIISATLRAPVLTQATWAFMSPQFCSGMRTLASRMSRTSRLSSPRL
jgi:urocanate hydratase